MQNVLTLKSLAHSRSTLARASLFEKISDLWIDDGAQLTSDLKDVMDGVLLDLLPDIETAARARIAVGLAKHAHPPHKLLEALATDPEIIVSGPVLEAAPSLSEACLLNVSAMGGSVHRLAISKRRSLSNRLTDALILRHENALIRTLIDNPGAALSRNFYRSVADLLREDEGLCAKVLARSDLPKDFALQMFWWCPAAMRHSILTRTEFDANALPALLLDILSETSAPLQAVDPVDADAETLDWTAVTEWMQAGALPRAVKGIATLLSVSPELVARALNDEGGEALSVVACALGADAIGFERMLDGLDRARGRLAPAAGELQDLKTLFDSLKKANAAKILAIWNAQLRARS